MFFFCDVSIIFPELKNNHRNGNVSETVEWIDTGKGQMYIK